MQSIEIELGKRLNGRRGGIILRIAKAAGGERDAPPDAQIESLEHRADENAPCSQHLAGEHSVFARYAVLCTNGYDNLAIEGIDSSIMKNTHGVVGFMIGCLDEVENEPVASAYFDSRWHDPDDGYYYLSSLGYTDTGGSKRTLICVGGQDEDLTEEERRCYDFIEGKEEHYSQIESFYLDTIVGLPNAWIRTSSGAA